MIGLNDTSVEGTFRWSDGSMYTNDGGVQWAAGEPNNSGSREHCVDIGYTLHCAKCTTLVFNDMRCDTRRSRRGLCEIVDHTGQLKRLSLLLDGVSRTQVAFILNMTRIFTTLYNSLRIYIAFANFNYNKTLFTTHYNSSRIYISLVNFNYDKTLFTTLYNSSRIYIALVHFNYKKTLFTTLYTSSRVQIVLIRFK